MPVERALTAYKHERLNCAQSVLRAFQASHQLDETHILAAKEHGHGRVEAGLCGALHSALHLAGDTVARERVRVGFMAETGSDKCREIRRAARKSCAECVQLAASLIDGESSSQPKETV
jgi:hypothetical protein